MVKGQSFGEIGTKLANFGAKIPNFLGKLQKFRPNGREKVHCKGMIFHGNSLHCKGPILESKFWAERMVVLRSSAPPPGIQPLSPKIMKSFFGYFSPSFDAATGWKRKGMFLIYSPFALNWIIFNDFQVEFFSFKQWKSSVCKKDINQVRVNALYPPHPVS